MEQKNLNRLRVIIAEKNLTNKRLSEQLGEAIFTDDVKRIKFKQHMGNKYVYLFLKAAILKQKSKYQYGYKFSGERMNRQKITLPATDNSIPDFENMEKYMRNLEAKLLLQYTQMRLVQY